MTGRMTRVSLVLVSVLTACTVLASSPDNGASKTARRTGESAHDAERPPGTLAFLKERKGRRWTHVPRRVLAFYYTWYGRPERHGRWIHWAGVRPEDHEIATSTHYPARGAYDSHDPEIIDYHIDLARSHGVDGFICTWWGQGTYDDVAFAKVLDRAKEKDFEATIYWETARGSGPDRVQRAVGDLVYVLEKYGEHPAFLRVDGKPVIFVYGRVMGQVPLEEWKEIIPAVEARYPMGFLLIADGYTEAYARLFDGVHTYNICGWVRGKTAAELREASAASFASAVDLAKRHARISCITVIPGYDDTKIRTPGLRAERLGGETCKVLWEEAIRADPDWVLITSWNEWHEGSEIEPSHEDGDLYVRLTGEYARKFKSTPFSSRKVPELAGGVDPETARRLRELYEGATVGVLPDFTGNAVFWLAETGVALREFAWEDVVDPDVLDPSKVPVLVYAGYESYRRTVRSLGDVDGAIVRYLSDGGLLLALAAGPFPFFYDETHEAVHAAGMFGFPIHGGGAPGGGTIRGWESPPEGVRLRFEIDSKYLGGLPARIPFPEDGDLRWRPCSGSGLPPTDTYLPLVRLRDSRGREYGDAAAYIEHRASEPRGGKCIYAWMRLPDVLDRDVLYLGLFRLAAEKMARPNKGG